MIDGSRNATSQPRLGSSEFEALGGRGSCQAFMYAVYCDSAGTSPSQNPVALCRFRHLERLERTNCEIIGGFPVRPLDIRGIIVGY